MPGPNVVMTTSGALKAAIISEFHRSYDLRMKVRNPNVAACFQEMESTRLVETHGGFAAVPAPKRWQRGVARHRSAFSEFYATCQNHAWDLWVGWHEEDEQDDQTKKLMSRVSDGALRFSQLDERVLIQLITSTTDPTLLPSIPNCYDGIALTSATARPGLANGNILTGSGVASASAIRSDFQSVVGKRFGQMQDGESQPYWTEQDLAFSNFMIVFNWNNIERFNDAFKTSLLPAGPLSSAPVDNSYLKADAPRLFPTQRITDDSFYVFLIGATGSAKPFIKQIRQPLRQLEQNPANSDEARDTKEKGVGWDARFGYAPWEWRTVCKVSN